MTVLYVASDQPGVGKTAMCAALANDLKQRGKRAAAFKPLASSAEPQEDTDAEIYARLLGQPEPDIRRPAPKTRLSPARLKETVQRTEEALKGNDVLLVEAASTLSQQATVQLVGALDAKLLLVAGYRPGLEASDLSPWRERFGEKLLGTVINGITRYQGTELSTGVLPSLRAEGLTPLGAIPEDRQLLAVTVGEVTSHLGGRFTLGEEFADRLVQYFLVGGWGLDAGELYFGLRESKAVIVRGDRPDMQMAALATPTTCMLVTQGIEPIEYVRNEAELEEVPIIVVDADTLSTMDALNTLSDRARFDHPAKLDRSAELLREHVDLKALYAGLGVAA